VEWAADGAAAAVVHLGAFEVATVELLAPANV
jgi:hypothetical protein